MDNPRGAVCGEKIFSQCCQSIGGLGEECMKHSQLSRNGGILEIRAEDGTYIGQSWCWVNGNVLCFDSAELKALDNNPNMTSSEKEEYLRLVKIGYEQMAKRMIEESNKKVEEYVKKKKNDAKDRYGEDSQEYIEAEREIEERGEQIKIKQVTIGKGYWPISKKLSEMFEKEGRKIEKSREDRTLAKPIEDVNYIDDSKVQYELARAEEVKREEIRTVREVKEQEAIYTDRRSIIQESGSNIGRDTIARIKKIEKAAHKESMQMMGNMNTAYDEEIVDKLAGMYGDRVEDLRVIVGEDWYYVYGEREDEIEIHDAARAPKARIEGEEAVSQAELIEGFYEIMGEAARSGKKMIAQLREDTSYVLYRKMLEKGQLEQIGEERLYEFEEAMGLEDEGEGTIMHEIECKVTDKGKKMIERMRKRQGIEEQDGENRE